MYSKTFENEYCVINISNGIMFICYNDISTKITLPIAKQNVEDRLLFQQKAGMLNIPAIIHVNVKYSTKEARVYLSDKGSEGILAAALIAKKMVSKTLVRIFLAVEKPPIPTKLFDNEEDAINWLQEENYIQKNCLVEL